MRRVNWLLWSGFLLSIAAFLSYFVVFARWPVTRDVPWVNYLLFIAAIALVVAGIRRAPRKVLASIVGGLGVAIAVFFVAIIVFGSRQMPVSAHAPHVGEKAPDFTLLDTNRKPVSLSQLLASAPKGVVLIFYRGYW